MRIKKGDKFNCIQDYVMDSGSTAFIKNKTYISTKDKCIKSELFEEHDMDDEKDFNLYFEVSKEEQIHYDNTNGSLYQFCEQQQLNSYEFDIIKRVMRCRKKGNFIEDLEKTKFLIDLYIKENMK